jgi:hypothetical protein
MTVTTKEEALAFLCSLRTDFELLASGDWHPDEDSVEASIGVVNSLIEFMEMA